MVRGGVPHLRKLLSGLHVVIVGENDGGPGVDGAWAVAKQLADVCASVRVIFPPDGAKDLRDWYTAPAGCDRDELLAAARAADPVEPDEDDSDTAGDIIERAEPLRLAEHFIDTIYNGADGSPDLRRWRGDFYRASGAGWQTVSDEVIRAELYSHLDRLQAPNDDGILEPLKPSSRMVGEVMSALPSRGLLLQDNLNPPFWLDGRDSPDPAKLVPVQNAILEPCAMEVREPTPALFTTTPLPVRFDANAPEPAAWLDFLQSIWPDDPAAIFTLQEYMGYSLLPDTRQQKILMLVGPKRSGKGTIARIWSALLGEANTSSPTLASLGTNFGLSPLIDKLLAIISDARLTGRTDHAAVTERLLSISGEDAVTIDRKHQQPVTTKLPTRFVMMTNELPRMADSSGALAGRFLILRLTRSWYGHEDHALTDKLLAELPGILNWCLEGLRSLHERGRFQQPDSGTEAMQELEDLGSPVGAFIRDRCTIGPGHWIEQQRLYRAWCVWCESEGRTRTGTRQTFGRDLRAVVPGIQARQVRIEGEQARIYEGVGLTE